MSSGQSRKIPPRGQSWGRKLHWLGTRLGQTWRHCVYSGRSFHSLIWELKSCIDQRPLERIQESKFPTEKKVAGFLQMCCSVFDWGNLWVAGLMSASPPTHFRAGFLASSSSWQPGWGHLRLCFLKSGRPSGRAKMPDSWEQGQVVTLVRAFKEKNNPWNLCSCFVLISVCSCRGSCNE